MPIYDYICVNGHVVEVVHRVHDPGPAVCPQCGAPVRKRIVPSAIHFRGSGWAKQDARNASARHAKKPAGEHESHDKGAGHEGGSAAPSSGGEE